MKKILLICMSLYVGSIHAALISPSSASGTGTFNNAPGLIIDNIFPSEGSFWNTSAEVYWNTTIPQLTIDLGALYNVTDVLVSVDNNDNYTIQWSSNASSWNNLFNIPAAAGEIGYGMDTFSTDSSNAEYVAALDFSAVQAQYLRIFSTGGDNAYSVGELQAFGNVAAVPVPASIWLLGSGLIALFGMRKKG